METKNIKATFRGLDNSLGYRTNKEYILTIWEDIINNKECIIIKRLDNLGYCEYNSIISFLNNWDNIINFKYK